MERDYQDGDENGIRVCVGGNVDGTDGVSEWQAKMEDAPALIVVFDVCVLMVHCVRRRRIDSVWCNDEDNK